MNILTIQPFLRGYTIYPVAGGKDKAALEIARILAAAGHSIDILALPWGIERRNTEWLVQAQPVLLSADGLQARVLPTVILPSAAEIRQLVWRFLTRRCSFRHPAASGRDIFWSRLPEKRRSIAHALRIARPDLLLVHQSASDVPVIARACGYHGPMVLVHHSAGLGAFVSHYDHVVFVNSAQEAEALRRYPQMLGRTSVIRYFAGEEYFVPISPVPRREITFIGIMDSERKGLDLLLQACAEEPRLRDVVLNVVGDGRLRQRWERLAGELGVRARFHGRISHVANAEILSRSGAYVMPSRGEGLALTYLEALCMGVPIIGYPPNVRELETLLGRSVGFAFHADVDAVSQLAERIVTLTADDSPLTSSDRQKIATAVRNRFSLETFHREYTEFFRQFEPGRENK